MATSTRTKRRVLFAVALIVTATGAIGVASQSSSADAAVGLEELSVGDTNQTVDGDVQAVRMTGTAQYEYQAADAESRTVELRVGPDEENLETIGYVYADRVDGSASGTVDLDGDVLDHSAWTAADFDPALAETETTDMVVELRIEVTRANGETVTAREVRDVTLDLTDGSVVDASVGGDMQVVVETTDE